MSANILQFPRDRQVRPLTESDVNASVQQIQITHIERVVDGVAEIMFEAMCRAGFCLHSHDEDEEESDEQIKDQALIYNALRSAAFRQHGIFHPLQKTADEMFEAIPSQEYVEDDGEEVR